MIQFDLGIGDPITPSPIPATTKQLLSDSEISWKVYPIETIIAEKIHAWVDRGAANSRAKDIFDLYQFLPMADPGILRQALQNCFQYRETPLPKDLSRHLDSIDLSFIEKGWKAATAGIKDVPSLIECVRAIVIALK